MARIVANLVSARSLGVLLTATFLAVGLWFCIFIIWPLDIFSKRADVLGISKAKDGSVAAVVQWWNEIDFYSTWILFYSAEEAKWYCNVIDGDDSKRWRIAVVIDQKARVITVGTGQSASQYEISSTESSLRGYPLFDAKMHSERMRVLDAMLPQGLNGLVK